MKKVENKRIGPSKPSRGNSDLRAMIQAARQKARQEKSNANGDAKVTMRDTVLLSLSSSFGLGEIRKLVEQAWHTCLSLLVFSWDWGEIKRKACLGKTELLSLYIPCTLIFGQELFVGEKLYCQSHGLKGMKVVRDIRHLFCLYTSY